MFENNIKNELEKLMKEAILNNEVPIAAIITCNDNIIAKNYNQVEKNQNFMNHAEILVINEAMRIKNNWRLSDCNLYVTLEPCSMCKEIIKKSRIKNVYYYSKQNKQSTENNPIYYFCKCNNFSNMLKIFFKAKRN